MIFHNLLSFTPHFRLLTFSALFFWWIKSLSTVEGEGKNPPRSWIMRNASFSGRRHQKGWKVAAHLSVLVSFLFHQVLRDSQLGKTHFPFMVTQTHRKEFSSAFNVKHWGFRRGWKVHCQCSLPIFRDWEVFSFFGIFVCEVLRVTRWLTEWEAFVRRHQVFQEIFISSCDLYLRYLVNYRLFIKSFM